MKEQIFKIQWGGKELSIKVGKLAQQAGGSCVVQYGETVVLVTATMSAHKREGLNWFPLMVDFEEKMYAAGRIKGSRFMKRAGRPTDEAVLTSRTIDRALRPLFDQTMRNDIQVIVSCLSFDGVNDPDIIGLIGASCALHMSEIPWNGPIGTIRVGQVDGEWVINPTYEEREKSVLDLMFSGNKDKVVMVEAGANEATEEVVLGAFWHGMDNLEAPIKLIEEVRAAVGKEKRDMAAEAGEEEKEVAEARSRIENLARPYIIEQVKELFFGAPQATKGERGAQKGELKDRTKAFLAEQGIEEEEIGYGTAIIHKTLEAEVSRAIVEEGKRVDGRSLTEIRHLVSETSILPRVHGSAHFMRGETQVVTIVTLGSPGDEQLLDGMEIEGKKRYFHHYNFPPYSVGEVKPLRGPSRRDIGHGGLAEKALIPMMPDKESFPYTIQAVSEVMGSNGSSSMGSTCGSTLSLMDAGVPIKAPVAGIAMGLGYIDDNNWKVLTDLQDLEDGKGGMDFKIAGSRDGITAMQMDTKTDGLTREMIKQTFNQGLDARLQILDAMAAEIAEPRDELSEHAPRIISLRINPELIGNVIGPGGKIINGLIEDTGVGSIDIDDDGLVMITSTDAAGAEEAKKQIELLTKEVKVGDIYGGTVVRLMDFGAIVEFLPKRDGMVHVSMMAPWRVEKVTDIVKLGDEVQVKVMEMANGKISLSMKDAPGNKLPERPAPRPRSDSDRRGSGDRRPTRPSSPRPPRRGA
jgi:polyribonucleotide nucleotidyltransferase